MKGLLRTIRVAVWLAAIGLPALALAHQAAEERTNLNSGAMLYREHCASCHGATGKGDGPAASTLRKKLSDLSTIATRNGGTFPTERITRIVDGRTPPIDHLRNDMPLWGAVLTRLEGGDETTVGLRIEGLIAHIRSLQVPPLD